MLFVSFTWAVFTSASIANKALPPFCEHGKADYKKIKTNGKKEKGCECLPQQQLCHFHSVKQKRAVSIYFLFEVRGAFTSF